MEDKVSLVGNEYTDENKGKKQDPQGKRETVDEAMGVPPIRQAPSPSNIRSRRGQKRLDEQRDLANSLQHPIKENADGVYSFEALPDEVKSRLQRASGPFASGTDQMQRYDINGNKVGKVGYDNKGNAYLNTDGEPPRLLKSEKGSNLSDLSQAELNQRTKSALKDSSAIPSNAIPAEALPAEAIPSNAIPAEALPAEAIPSNIDEALSSEAIPSNVVDEAALPAEGIPSNIDDAALPAEGIPSNLD